MSVRPGLRPAAVVPMPVLVLVALVLALAAIALLAPPAHGAASARCAAQRGASEPQTARALRLELRCLINVQRIERGLPRLRPNGALFRAASRHARDMVRRRYFSHNSPSGGGPTSRIAGAGYLRASQAWAVGENIAWQQGNDPQLGRVELDEQPGPPPDAALRRAFASSGSGSSPRRPAAAAASRPWSTSVTARAASQQTGLRADSSRL